MEQDITRYIPQAAPFVMIGELLETTPELTRTSFEIKADNILVRDGKFTTGGLVENMAQTAAAGTGYLAQQEGKAPQVGFIGALKNLSVQELPAVGATITTEVRFMHQVLNVHIVQGSVFAANKQIASCELKIFLQQ